MCLKLLREGHYVTGMWVNIDNNQVKNDMERSARTTLSDKLYELFPLTWRYSEYNGPIFNLSTNGVLPRYVKFHQMPVWIYGCHWVATMGEFDAIAIGYVMNDDAVSFIEDFRRAYESLRFNFQDDNMFTGLPRTTYPMLEFPLCKTKKQVIYAHMEKAGLLGLCWTCEMPIDSSPCGRCSACIRRNEIDGRHHKLYVSNGIDISQRVATLMNPSELPQPQPIPVPVAVPHHIVGSNKEDSPFSNFAVHGMSEKHLRMLDDSQADGFLKAMKTAHDSLPIPRRIERSIKKKQGKKK